jgi:ABC-type branched-subunit amino acid transport system substrate-binding protein
VLEELAEPSLMEDVGWDVANGAAGVRFGLSNATQEERIRGALERLHGGEPEDVGRYAIPYDAVYLLALAAETAQSTNPAAMRAAMLDVANAPGQKIDPGSEQVGLAVARQLVGSGGSVDYEGASGPIEFDANGDNTRTIASFWHVDGANKTFVRDKRYLVDITDGTFEELPCVDPGTDDTVCTTGTP